MSTKTTFKRIALVAVAALGFGVLTSVAPATAVGPSTMSIPVTDYTFIGNDYGFITVNLTDADGPAALDTGESITATVIDAPKGLDSTTAASDILFAMAKRTANASGVSTYASANNLPSSVMSDTDTAGSFSVQALATNAVGITNVTSNKSGTYTFAVKRASTKAVDKGTYTIRFRLNDKSNFVTQTNVSVRWVTSAADSGAVITLASKGSFVAGETVTMTATQSLTATLRNANGGRIQETGAITAGPTVPTLVAGLWEGTTPAIVGATSNWFVSDTGTHVSTPGYAGDHFSATTTDSATAFASYADGVYGIGHVSGYGLGLGVTNLSKSPYFRVTYGATAATLAITVRNAIGGTGGAVVFTGAGVAAINAANTFTLPLTTKTASFSVSGATPGNTYSYSVVYTSVAAGDQTPLDKTATAVIADSAGVITVPVTVANPVDGASAVVTITGFAATNPAAQTINWVRSKATNLSVDLSGAVVALKSTTVFTATVTDAFGAPVAGVLLQPSLSSTGSNGSATLVLPTVTTDASGKATYSLTDAKAVAAGTDTVTFTGVGTTGMTAKSSVITYAATAPAPTTLTPYVSTTPATTTGGDDAIRVAPSAAGVYRSAGQAFTIQKSRNNSVATTVVNSADQLRIVVSAGVEGAAVRASASTGAYVLSSASLQSASRTQYTGTTGFTPSFVVGSNKTGANTITFTSGTATTTVAFWVENIGTDARFVKLAQASAGSPVVASVTDRYGNGVSGADVQISTSAGTLGNGQMTTVYKTDLNGNVSVVPVGSDAATITAIATATNAEHAALAGFTTAGVQIDSTVAAGNSTATLAVTPAASAVDVAQAATDAAAEATDAANAATDAANAAAEAADAATAAAQDAADAVAALSTQVSEMVNALKKQITALTNLVIKIQKKVRA
jgi:trimeric autotransporter adhesin